MRSFTEQWIKDFANDRRSGGGFFTAEELRLYLTRFKGAAPGTPDRILRDMRAKGLIDYVVTNRKKSEYRFLYDGAVVEAQKFLGGLSGQGT